MIEAVSLVCELVMINKDMYQSAEQWPLTVHDHDKAKELEKEYQN